MNPFETCRHRADHPVYCRAKNGEKLVDPYVRRRAALAGNSCPLFERTTLADLADRALIAQSQK